MGGTVCVQSKLNVGTDFIINFRTSCSILVPEKAQVHERKSPKASRNSSESLLSLNLEKIFSDDSESVNINTEKEKTKAVQAKPTVLLVNDNFPLLSAMEDRLLPFFTVECADNGLEAYNGVRDKPPNYYSVIILDINMPIMDGFEACNNICSYLKGAIVNDLIGLNQDDKKS